VLTIISIRFIFLSKFEKKKLENIENLKCLFISHKELKYFIISKSFTEDISLNIW